jgi:hypothetical protein
MPSRRLIHAVVLMLVAGSPALAQSPERPVEVGLGVGYARALHGDLDYGSAAFSGSIRFPLRARLAFEGDLGFWSHSDMQSFGTAQTRSSRSFWSIEGSLLFVGAGERVQPFGGGGLGVYFDRSSFSQMIDQGPDVELTRTQGPQVGAQALGGIDVEVLRRLKIFGAFRFELRSFTDPGGAAVYRIEGGVRLPLRS